MKSPLTQKEHKKGLPGASTGLMNKKTKTHEVTFNTDRKQQIWQWYKKERNFPVNYGLPVIPKGI